MITLFADFNGIGCEIEGCVLASRHPFVDLRTILAQGEQVLVADGEGCSCEGWVERINPGEGNNYYTCYVRLDVTTWHEERRT